MIAFLINEINIRGGTHKQLLRLLEYAEFRKVNFLVITKNLDFDLTYPEFRKYEKKILEIPQFKNQLPHNRFASYLIKLFLHHDYYIKLRKATSKIETINIHDGGFEYFLKAFRGKKIYWQINDLHGCFIQKNSFTFPFPINILRRIKCLISRKIIIKNTQYVTAFTVNVSKNRYLIQKYFKRDASVFYCGVDSLSLLKDTKNTLERFSKKKINLLTSGVFFPYRNYETQIKIVKNLLLEGYDVHLDIIGSTTLSPDYVNKIKCLINDEKLNNVITIHGQVDEMNFNFLHQHADLFLFINIDQSWGLAVFEAMSCGLPVIVSESVGATEILTNNDNAIFVNPLDDREITRNITEIINNKEYYMKLSNNSRRLCSEYTWDNAYSLKMLNLMLPLDMA